MNTLRNRIALLLIFAIVTVVALATLAAFTVLRPPRPETTMEPVARQIQTLAALAGSDPRAVENAGGRIERRPARGMPEERLSHFLAGALRHTGAPRMAFVARRVDGPGLTASVRLRNGSWLVTDLPEFEPPKDRWHVLAGWIFLIVTGSTIVSVFAAGKITKPLGLIESAVAAVGRDGMLPPVPEEGPPEVRATARALNRLSDRLKSAMESRMRLVAAAGHDLRTPMTRMRLRAEFIADPEERQKWLDDLAELDMIADSAIRLVREEANSDGVEPVRLDRLARDVVDELADLGMSVEAGDLAEVSIEGGPLALKRALRNLVINAATHGRGAFVEVARHGDEAVLTVTDSGPGIPEDLIAHAFEPFFRVDASRRKVIPGAGLGLAIAKEIVERFGGRIAIANRKPTGLAQTVVFAVADFRGEAPARPPVEMHQGRQVVDRDSLSDPSARPTEGVSS